MRRTGRDRIVVDVPHRGDDLKYPLLVDPSVVEQFGLGNYPWTTHGWVSGSTPGITPAPKAGADASGGSGPGVYLAFKAGVAYPTNSYMQWQWASPPGTYIYRTEFGWVEHAPASTSFVLGLLSAKVFDWEQNFHIGGSTNPNPWSRSVAVPRTYYTGCFQSQSTLEPCDPNQGDEPNIMIMRLERPSSTAKSTDGSAYMESAVTWLNDHEGPQVTTPKPSAVWFDDGSQTRSYTPRAVDAGLGIYSMTLVGPNGATTPTRNRNCLIDIYADPTPTAVPCHNATTSSNQSTAWDPNDDGGWSTTYNYQLNEGTNDFQLYPQDVSGKGQYQAAQTWSEHVDRTPPHIDSYSGGLRPNAPDANGNRDRWVSDNQSLTVNASDAKAGVADVSGIKTDDVQMTSIGVARDAF
jgi:hypothetical protein